MTDFATRFAQAKTGEEFGSAVLDVIRGNPSGIDPIMILINVASQMAMSGSKSQRQQVAQHMRSSATAIEAGSQ